MYLDIKSSKIYTVVDKPLKLYGIMSILKEPVLSKPVNKLVPQPNGRRRHVRGGTCALTPWMTREGDLLLSVPALIPA